MWTLYWVYGLVDRSLNSRLIQPCRKCTAVCAACSRATSARNWRTSAIRDSVSVMAPVSARARAGVGLDLGPGTEPVWQMVEQVPLAVAGPGHVAVRSQQHGRHVQLVADVDDVINPVRPSRDGELTGLVEQQPASSAHQLVETTARQADVTQPPADQPAAFTEVVAHPDPGDLLDQEPAHVLEVHQLGQQPAHRLWTGFG